MDINTLLSASSFAVVGASADEHKVGHQILRNLHSNPDLTVYPVNLKGGTILDLRVYTHLWETPKPAEVVIICVPIMAVESVIDECVKIKAKAVVLITAGFAEAGVAGSALQSKIVDKLRGAGISLLGPNTMGYIAPNKQIYASFGPSEVSGGPIAVISQSGAILSALFGEYVSAGTGISFALSLGNKTGINENDALAYALTDHETRVVAIYLESLADPKQLLTIAKELSTTKPIFLLKGGVTEAGRAAAVSHTASLATSQVLLDELCHQAGIVQVNNFEQFVRASVAAAKTTFLPENLMIITNAGGPAVLLTDEISQLGIPLFAPPLDLLGDASPEQYDLAISKYSTDLAVDTIVAIVTEQAVTDLEGITKVLSRKRGKHLLFACLAGGDELEPYRLRLKSAGVIVTRYPNEIAETIAALLKAKKCLDHPLQTKAMPVTNINKYPQTYESLSDLLKKYDLPMPASHIISKEEDLETIHDLGWPVIAKTTNLRLLHKAKLGAVIPDILNDIDAKFAFSKLQQWGTQILFQQKITEGIEVLLGAHKDPFWGWYIAVGMGGSLSDTYDDRAYIFLPATKEEFRSAMNRTKLSSLLSQKAQNNLIGAIMRLQDCVLETTDLLEIEINPLFVTDTNVMAADLKRA